MGTITFKIYPDLRMAYFQGIGDVSHDMIIDKIRHLHKHPEWRLEFNTFIDFEKAVVKTGTEIFLKYKSVFDALQQKTPVRKWAIYTRQEIADHAAGMSLLLNARSIIVDVFQHRDDALRFLDVSPQQFSVPGETE
ncbi:MAG: hypothetical protein ACD_75C00519G0007 [uncultured bacterium]|nr:MAG: hypothetical protein ACD_75C00519G0007 [uncultured bacterium]